MPVVIDADDEAPFDPPDNLADALGAFAEEEEETVFALMPALGADEPLLLEASVAAPDAPPQVDAVAEVVEPEAAPVAEPVAEVVTASAAELEPACEAEPEAEEPGAAFDPELAAKAGFFAVPPPSSPEAEADEPEPVAPVRDYPSAPPINVWAFWDRADAEVTFAAFARDSKLRRASVSVRRGGLDGAIAAAREASNVDLVIIDSDVGAGELLSGLERLGPLLPAEAKVVVIGAINDIPLLRALAARRVSEYAVAPVTSEHLVRSVCELYADRDNARVIAVVGARGGVGASTIARNLAWSIAERQRQQATLVDLDLAFGAGVLGPDARPRPISDVLPANGELDLDALEQAIVSRGERLEILSAPAPLQAAFEPDLYGVDAVIGRVRRSSRFVVVDVPHAWNNWVKHVLTTADDVVLVATPDLAALRNADHVLKVVRARKDALQPVLVLSMTGVPKRPEIAAREFAATLDLEPAATFAFDAANFGACETAGHMLGEGAPKSKAAALIDALGTALTGIEATATPAPAPAMIPVAPKPAPEPMTMKSEAMAVEAPVEDTLEPQAPAQADVLELATLAPAPEAEPLAPPVKRAPKRRAHALLDRALAATVTDHPTAMPKPRKRLGFGAPLAAMALLGVAVQLEVRAPVTHAVTQLNFSVPWLGLQRAPDMLAALKQEAEAGSASAQYRLAKAYERGAGVAVDADAARRWTERAAMGGHVRAMHDLGVYAAATRQDQQAFRWFRQAADFGLVDSQYNLGVMYADGRGVSANAGEALFWFLVAARQGDEAAGARAEALGETLTPMDVERAQLRAEAFRAHEANAEANRLS